MSEKRKRQELQDEHVENDDDEERPRWSTEPDQGWLCDFSIEIAAQGTNQVVRYNVHRLILATPPRTSSYFVRLFKNNFSESTCKVSRIQDLTKAEALVFPGLLDYIYGDEIVLNKDNSAALYKLSDYFGVSSLLASIEAHWENNMRVEDFEAYFAHSNLYNIDKLKELLCAGLSDWIDTLPRDSNILSYIDSQLLLDLVKRKRKDSIPRVGWLVAEVCLKEKNNLSAETFAVLTSESNLPVTGISFESAIKLLDVEKEVATLENNTGLTNLQKRCVQALSLHWFHMDPSDIQQLLTNNILDPIVLAATWQATVARTISESTPHTIAVSGAGCPEVNGVYVRDHVDLRQPYPKIYVKDGIWKNKQQRFYIYRAGPVWRIDVIPYDDDETKKVNLYYHRCQIGGDYEVLPKFGWLVNSIDGVAPPPTLEYENVSPPF